jgi:hypothetical protein
LIDKRDFCPYRLAKEQDLPIIGGKKVTQASINAPDGQDREDTQAHARRYEGSGISRQDERRCLGMKEMILRGRPSTYLSLLKTKQASITLRNVRLCRGRTYIGPKGNDVGQIADE